MEIIASIGAVVEQMSVDEAYLDVSALCQAETNGKVTLKRPEGRAPSTLLQPTSEFGIKVNLSAAHRTEKSQGRHLNAVVELMPESRKAVNDT